MSDSIGVLVVDDHPIYRAGLAAAINATPGIHVAGTAATGLQAVEAVAALAPAVVLMDLTMPQMGGIDATRAIAGQHGASTAILVLTMSEDSDSVWAAMRAGARGYLVKGAESADIVEAIRSLARGEILFGPTIANRVLRFFQAPAGAAPTPFPELTPREVEILQLVAAGHTNAHIAERAYLSGKTVRNHVSNIFTKLNVGSRNEAIRRARDAGFAQDDQH